jgi:superfamily II DNA or RNA helicase
MVTRSHYNLSGSQGKKNYLAERKQVIDYGYRFQAIWSLISLGYINTSDNTLILMNYIGEIDAMIALLKENIPSDHHHIIHRISGSVTSKKRDGVFDTMTNSGGNITVATYETMSTGINIKRLNNIVLGSPLKEDTITLLQAIGRVLRTHETKETAYVYDITDYIPKGNRDAGMKNHGYIAMTHRVRAYIDEEYPFVAMNMIPSENGPIVGDEFDMTRAIEDAADLDE